MFSVCLRVVHCFHISDFLRFRSLVGWVAFGKGRMSEGIINPAVDGVYSFTDTFGPTSSNLRVSGGPGVF